MPFLHNLACQLRLCSLVFGMQGFISVFRKKKRKSLFGILDYPAAGETHMGRKLPTCTAHGGHPTGLRCKPTVHTDVSPSSSPPPFSPYTSRSNRAPQNPLPEAARRRYATGNSAPLPSRQAMGPKLQQWGCVPYGFSLLLHPVFLRMLAIVLVYYRAHDPTIFFFVLKRDPTICSWFVFLVGNCGRRRE